MTERPESTIEDAHEQREALTVAERKGRKAVEKRAQALARLEVEYVNVGDLKPNLYNPNRQSDDEFELLLRSMEEDGFTQPVIAVRVSQEMLDNDPHEGGSGWAAGDKVIVDGEHRWRAARKLGYEEVPAVFVDMAIEQMRIATLRHNRARGTEDVALVGEVLRDLRQLGALEWAADSLMLADVELERLMDDVAAPEMLAADAFSEAWEPDKTFIGDEKLPAENLTARASDAIRDREKKLANAKTAEDRAQVRKETDRDLYRVSVIFHGDEAEVVRAVISGAPADTILQLCSGAYDEMREGGFVAIDAVIGRRTVTDTVADKLRAAIAEAMKRGDVKKGTKYELLGQMAEAYIASPAKKK